jgi:hypothetical protein
MQQPRSRHLRSIPVANDNSDAMPDMPFEEGAHDALDPDLRHRMISEAAFYLYAQRAYEDGFDLDDWLLAEAQIDHIIMNPDRGAVVEEA